MPCHHLFALFLAAAVACTGAVQGADPIEPAGRLPAAGTLPWGDDPLTRAVLTTPGAGFGEVVTVTDHGTRFPTVLELRTLNTVKPADNPWDLQASIPSTGVIEKGDTLFVEFWMRTVSTRAESGEGSTTLIVERRGPPWDNTIRAGASAPGDGAWVRHASAAPAADHYEAGGAQLNFHLGTFRTQAIQVAGLRVVDLGPGVLPESLPVRGLTYPGRSATAPWRAEAAARIERYRKNDLTVQVVDAAGAPVPGARVRAEMVRPAFPFGSAVGSDNLVAPGPDGDRYRAWVLAHCDLVVIENHLKWGMWEGGITATGVPIAATWGRQATLDSLQWLQEHQIPIKGHTLIWPSWWNAPERLKALASDPAALRAACDDHIRDILDGTRRYGLVEWDVVNEAFANSDIFKALGGHDELVRWFREARAAFPTGGLIYNDYAHLVAAGRMTPHKQFAEDLVKELKAKGAPITGFGIQAHIGEGMSDPALVMAELDRLGSDLDLNLHITEYDLNLLDPACQADYSRDFLTACFASPRVTSFLMWGFWAGRHWLPAAALYRNDWTPRPQAKAIEDLVASWHAPVSGATNDAGVCSLRGFKGTYRITVEASDRTTTADGEIGDQPESITVRF